MVESNVLSQDDFYALEMDADEYAICVLHSLMVSVPQTFGLDEGASYEERLSVLFEALHFVFSLFDTMIGDGALRSSGSHPAPSVRAMYLQMTLKVEYVDLREHWKLPTDYPDLIDRCAQAARTDMEQAWRICGLPLQSFAEDDGAIALEAGRIHELRGNLLLSRLMGFRNARTLRMQLS